MGAPCAAKTLAEPRSFVGLRTYLIRCNRTPSGLAWRRFASTQWLGPKDHTLILLLSSQIAIVAATKKRCPKQVDPLNSGVHYPSVLGYFRSGVNEATQLYPGLLRPLAGLYPGTIVRAIKLQSCVRCIGMTGWMFRLKYV